MVFVEDDFTEGSKLLGSPILDSELPEDPTPNSAPIGIVSGPLQVVPSAGDDRSLLQPSQEIQVAQDHDIRCSSDDNSSLEWNSSPQFQVCDASICNADSAKKCEIGTRVTGMEYCNALRDRRPPQESNVVVGSEKGSEEQLKL